MATVNAVNVKLIWQLSGGDWAVNSLWFRKVVPGGLTQALVDEAALVIATEAATAGIANDYTPEVVLDRMEFRDHHTDGNPIWTAQTNLVGTRGGDMLPRQTCVVTTIRSALVSRRGRGRIYWPAPAAGLMASGGMGDPAELADFTAWVNAITDFTLSDGSAWDLSVFSRSDNTLRPVESASTDNSFDVQVRRRDVSI